MYIRGIYIYIYVYVYIHIYIYIIYVYTYTASLACIYIYGLPRVRCTPRTSCRPGGEFEGLGLGGWIIQGTKWMTTLRFGAQDVGTGKRDIVGSDVVRDVADAERRTESID